MDSFNMTLAQSLKLRFGTAPGEPSALQLERIKADIRRLVAAGRSPGDSDWLEVVKRHCPSAGSCVYKGLDNSDLVTLLRLATKPATS